MKSAVVLLCLLPFSFQASACEPSIIGLWKSDGPATMEFVRARAKFEPHQEAFLAALMGKMTLDITEHQLHLQMPAGVVPVNGELSPFDGFEERKESKIIFCNSQVAVVKTGSEANGFNVTTYYFVGTDQIWTYAGTNDPGVPDLHLREYYTRMR